MTAEGRPLDVLVDTAAIVGEVGEDSEGGLDGPVLHQLHLDLLHVGLNRVALWQRRGIQSYLRVMRSVVVFVLVKHHKTRDDPSHKDRDYELNALSIPGRRRSCPARSSWGILARRSYGTWACGRPPRRAPSCR